MVGDWPSGIMSTAGESDGGGWTVVGRTGQSEVRRRVVRHVNTHLQNCESRYYTLLGIVIYIIILCDVSRNVSITTA